MVHLPHTRTTRLFRHTRSGCLFMRVTRRVRYCAFECHFKFYWFLGSVGAYQSSSEPKSPIDCSISCYIRVLFLGIPLRMHLPPRIRALRPTPALWYSTPQPPPPYVSPLHGRDHISLCAHPLIVCNFSQLVFPPLARHRCALKTAQFLMYMLSSCVSLLVVAWLSTIMTCCPPWSHVHLTGLSPPQYAVAVKGCEFWAQPPI